MTTTPTAPVASPTPEQLAGLMASLRQVHASRRTHSLDWRLRQLEAVNRLLVEQERAIAEALEADLGRTAFESWFGDIAGTRGEVDFALKNLRKWVKPQRQRLPLTQLPGSAHVRHDPLGVVLVIGPWNYPVFLSLSPIVAAVAAGNCVVLKPSEMAPATSALLARIIPQYLDPQAVMVVEGDGATTQDLLALGFDHALFTGGTEIGRKIMAGAAATLTPVTLELGGKSPVVVTADADLEVVARRIAWVKLMNSGQTCIAPDYVLVDNAVKDELVAAVVAAVKASSADRPEGMRIVNGRQHERLRGYLESTRATVALGGGTDRDRLLVEPTVLVDPDPDELAMTDEIFGPILPIIGFDRLDQATAFVNARPKPLALYVFSRSKETAQRLVDVIPSGGAVVNHIAIHCLVPSLPFGGVGASGMGAYHGRWGFEALSHRRAVLMKSTRPDLRFVYPPYGEKAQRLMRRLF